MKLPVIRGVIDRRILVNYRVESGVLAAMLPRPFRPQLVRGAAIVGICLIRLKRLRPVGLPGWFGVSSENAAHRAAVEWDEGCGVRNGVFVRRRDTNSRFNVLAGGRLFPGVHHHAEFAVHEKADRFEVAVCSDDGATNLSVRGHVTDALPASSTFGTLAEGSAFFQAGSLGYSASNRPNRFEGLELRCPAWQVEPLAIDEVRSSFFEDEALFPRGSIKFDCALLMRGVEHSWHGRGGLCCV